MSLRDTLRTPATLFRIGMLALLLGIVLNRLVHASPTLPQGLIDGARGLFFGISIGCLLQARRVQVRRSIRDQPGG